MDTSLPDLVSYGTPQSNFIVELQRSLLHSNGDSSSYDKVIIVDDNAKSHLFSLKNKRMNLVKANIIRKRKVRRTKKNKKQFRRDGNLSSRWDTSNKKEKPSKRRASGDGSLTINEMLRNDMNMSLPKRTRSPKTQRRRNSLPCSLPCRWDSAPAPVSPPKRHQCAETKHDIYVGEKNTELGYGDDSPITPDQYQASLSAPELGYFSNATSELEYGNASSDLGDSSSMPDLGYGDATPAIKYESIDLGLNASNDKQEDFYGSITLEDAFPTENKKEKTSEKTKKRPASSRRKRDSMELISSFYKENNNKENANDTVSKNFAAQTKDKEIHQNRRTFKRRNSLTLPNMPRKPGYDDVIDASSSNIHIDEKKEENIPDSSKTWIREGSSYTQSLEYNISATADVADNPQTPIRDCRSKRRGSSSSPAHESCLSPTKLDSYCIDNSTNKYLTTENRCTQKYEYTRDQAIPARENSYSESIIETSLHSSDNGTATKDLPCAPEMDQLLVTHMIPSSGLASEITELSLPSISKDKRIRTPTRKPSGGDIQIPVKKPPKPPISDIQIRTPTRQPSTERLAQDKKIRKPTRQHSNDIVLPSNSQGTIIDSAPENDSIDNFVHTQLNGSNNCANVSQSNELNNISPSGKVDSLALDFADLGYEDVGMPSIREDTSDSVATNDHSADCNILKLGFNGKEDGRKYPSNEIDNGQKQDSSTPNVIIDLGYQEVGIHSISENICDVNCENGFRNNAVKISLNRNEDIINSQKNRSNKENTRYADSTLDDDMDLGYEDIGMLSKEEDSITPNPENDSRDNITQQFNLYGKEEGRSSRSNDKNNESNQENFRHTESNPNSVDLGYEEAGMLSIRKNPTNFDYENNSRDNINDMILYREEDERSSQSNGILNRFNQESTRHTESNPDLIMNVGYEDVVLPPISEDIVDSNPKNKSRGDSIAQIDLNGKEEEISPQSNDMYKRPENNGNSRYTDSTPVDLGHKDFLTPSMREDIVYSDPKNEHEDDFAQILIDEINQNIRPAPNSMYLGYEGMSMSSKWEDSKTSIPENNCNGNNTGTNLKRKTDVKTSETNDEKSHEPIQGTGRSGKRRNKLSRIPKYFQKLVSNVMEKAKKRRDPASIPLDGVQVETTNDANDATSVQFSVTSLREQLKIIDPARIPFDEASFDNFSSSGRSKC